MPEKMMSSELVGEEWDQEMSSRQLHAQVRW